MEYPGGVTYTIRNRIQFKNSTNLFFKPFFMRFF